LQPYHGGTSYAYPNSYWSSEGGSNRVAKYRDPYDTGDIDGGWDKERPNG
jgi:hypothetical protein